MTSRLRLTPNLHGPMRPLSWSATTPCAEMLDSQRRRIQIPRLIIQVVDGIQNMLWRARVQTSAIVAGQIFLGILRRCELKKQRQKKKMRSLSLDRQS